MAVAASSWLFYQPHARQVTCSHHPQREWDVYQPHARQVTPLSGSSMFVSVYQPHARQVTVNFQSFATAKIYQPHARQVTVIESRIVQSIQSDDSQIHQRGYFGANCAKIMISSALRDTIWKYPWYDAATRESELLG